VVATTAMTAAHQVRLLLQHQQHQQHQQQLQPQRLQLKRLMLVVLVTQLLPQPLQQLLQRMQDQQQHRLPTQWVAQKALWYGHSVLLKPFTVLAM
jgi:hypothetical protein